MKKPTQVILAAAAFSLLFSALPAHSRQSIVLARIAWGVEDLLFRFRYSPETAAAEASRLAVVAIDDESCQRLDARWPWSRRLFAELIDALNDQGAKVIALNFSFNGLENGEESTRLMAEAIRRHGRVLVGATLDNDRLLKPNAILVEAGAHHGYLEKIVDDDLIIRRSFLARAFVGLARRWEPSFPLKALVLASEGEASALSTDELLGRWADGEGQYRINYLLKDADARPVPAWRVINGSSSVSFKGKVAFVGITSSLLAEKHGTPLGLMPGVFVHANEYVAMAAKRPLRTLPEPMVAAVSWLISLALFILLITWRFWVSVALTLGTIFAAFLAAQLALAHDWLAHPFLLLAGPGLALLLGVGTTLFFLFLEKQGLEKKVLHDKMTGLYTYEYLRLRLDDEWKRSQKLKLPVAVVMTDLDRFKKINDTLGHETGNQMILRAAAVIRDSVRGYDVVSRYGGDEFVILLWHSNLAEAQAYRERLRKLYEEMASKLEEPLLKGSSISIGVASFDPQSQDMAPRSPQELVEWADKDLFRDKESRRKPGEASR